MATVSGNSSLNFTGQFDIAQILANQQKVIQGFNDVKKSAETVSSSTTNTSLSQEKQASLDRLNALRDERIAIAAANKERAETNAIIAANKLAIQQQSIEQKKANDLLKEQAAAQKQLQPQKKTTQISNSQAEIDAYNKSTTGSNLYTSAINSQVVARARLNAEAARQAVANGTLTTSTNSYTSATSQQTEVDNRATLSKKQLAQALALEKLNQQQATAELRNSTKEAYAAKGSLDQREAALKRLVLQYKSLNEAERNSASGQRLNNIIKDLGAQVNKLDPTKIDKVASSLKKVPESLPEASGGSFFSNIFSSITEGALSVVAPLLAIGTVWSGVKAVFNHNVEISDTFADVQRTAKLTSDQVTQLADGLKTLNTRTSLDGLLDIATIGGRLGVRKNELPDFIKQVDELAVILKKELPGGAEAIAESLGKIVTIYKVTTAEGVSLGTALSKVGSNLLELAHSGPVTVKELQNFTLGVAGTAASAKLSIPVISAYGAVLLESGQIASSAALSVTRLVTGLTTRTGAYAAVAQIGDASLTLEKFSKIVNTDTKTALDLFFRGLKAGNPTQIEFSERLKSVGITTGKVTNSVKVLAENQDKLADRIERGSKAFEEGTSVAHNFEIANETIGASVDKLGNAISNLTTNPNSNMYNFFKGVVNGAARGVTGLSLFIDTVKGLTTNPIKFVGDSARKSRNESLDRLNDDAKKYAQYAFRDKDTDQERLDILKQEVKIRDIIQTKYLIAKATYDKIAPKDVSIADADRFNEIETSYQKQIALVRELNKLRNKKSVDITGTGENLDLDKDIRTTEVIKNEIKGLEDANKKLSTQSEVFKSNVRQIVKLRKELRLALGGKDTEGIKAENEYQSTLKSQRDLQRQIQEVINGSVKVQMSADDAEVKSIADKYDKIRAKAIEFNNSQKAIRNGLKTDIGGLATAELQEKQAAIDKASNERFKNNLADQTKNFQDVEDYRLKYGEDKAKDRYTKEYNLTSEAYDKQFSSAEAYAQRLEDLQTSILNKNGDSTGYSESQKQELDIATKEIQAFATNRKKIDDGIYDNAFNAAKTYLDKAKDIENQYQIERASLEKNGSLTDERSAQLLKEKEDRIRANNEENALSKSGYEQLIRDYDTLTRQQLIKRLNAVKAFNQAEYEAGRLTAEQLSKANSGIDSNLANLNKGNPFAKVTRALKDYNVASQGTKANTEGASKAFDVLKDAADAAGQYILTVIDSIQTNLENAGLQSDGLKSFIDGAKKAIEGVKGVVDGVGEIGQGIKDKNPVGVVTGAVKLLTSAISLFGNKDKKLQKQIDGYREQLNILGQAYKQLDRDVQNAVGNDIYGTQAAQIANLKAQQEELIKVRDAEQDKKKKDQSKIDDLNNQINDIPGKIDDINKSISQNLIQGTFQDLSNSLADALTNAFKAGTDGVDVLNQTFDEFIANAIKNSLKLALLQPVLSEFTKELTAYAQGNGNSVIGFDFEAWRKKLQDAGDQFNAGLKASDQFFKQTNEAANPSSVGNIRAELTESTAGRLEGLWRSQYDLTKNLVSLSVETNSIITPISLNMVEMLNVAKQGIDIATRNEMNTFRTANNTDALNTKLDQIITNTKGGSITTRGTGQQGL